MRAFPFHMFDVDCTYGDDEYFDVYIIDTGAKSARRYWCVTRGPNNKWYGHLRRSDTDDGDFDDGRYLPKKMVELFVAWLTMKGVV